MGDLFFYYFIEIKISCMTVFVCLMLNISCNLEIEQSSKLLHSIIKEAACLPILTSTWTLVTHFIKKEKSEIAENIFRCIHLKVFFFTKDGITLQK